MPDPRTRPIRSVDAPAAYFAPDRLRHAIGWVYLAQRVVTWSASRTALPTVGLVFAVVTIVGVGSTHAEPIETHRVTTTVHGIGHIDGGLCVALYDQPDGFPADRDLAMKFIQIPISGDPTTIDIDGLPDGTYALAVVHDENGNGKMDKSAIGMPTEGVGVSNGARSILGPPSFKKSSFEIDGADVELPITLIYPTQRR